MKNKSLPQCPWMAVCAPRKFPAPCETWLEGKGEQPAQPTGAVTFFCQKEAGSHAALVEQERGVKTLQDGLQGSSPSILLLPKGALLGGHRRV